ncbi:hypothetical protein HK405_008864, partial [Cladochytrium tenue]
IPAGYKRVTISASYQGLLYLWPGEIFWVVLEGDGLRMADAFSWLDSNGGVAWTAFQASGFDSESELLVSQEDSEDSFVAGAPSSAGPWVVERSASASSVTVLVE